MFVQWLVHYLLSGTTDSESEMANLKSIDPASNALTVSKVFGDFASDYQRAEIGIFEEDYLAVAIGQSDFEIWDPSNAFNKEWEYVLPTIEGYNIHANGVASEAGYAFLAAGELGVEVLKMNTINDFEDVGRIDFINQRDASGQNFSANHLIYEKHRLLVASGSGGIKIYDLNEL